MGIRGLNTMIKKIAPECITYNNIEKYSNSIVAIDCSILIYKFKYASKIENSHIVGIVNRIKFYMMHSILPVFVFDGVPPDEKRITIEKRQAAKYKLYEKLEALEEKIPENDEEKIKIDQEIKKLSSQLIVVKKTDIEECKELLEKSGIPYVSAPEDAEKYCAFLQLNNLVDYTITDDTDAMTFGCEKILKTNINKEIIEIDNKILLQKFKMNKEMFVDYCVLSGCDYTETLPQIGPVTAYNHIIKYGSIDNFLENNKEKQSDKFKYKEAKEVFTKFNYSKPLEKFTIKTINKENLLEFLKKHDFKETIIKKFIKILN